MAGFVRNHLTSVQLSGEPGDGPGAPHHGVPDELGQDGGQPGGECPPGGSTLSGGEMETQMETPRHVLSVRSARSHEDPGVQH